MSAADHDRFAEDAAAYLLGALENGERDAFEAHLEGCHVCQDDVARLKLAADALPRSVEQFRAPSTLKRGLMEQVSAEPRGERRAGTRTGRRSLSRLFARPRATLVASACALLVGLVAGVLIASGGGDGGGTRTVVAQVDASRIGDSHARLLVPEDGAARLEVSSMPQPPEGEVYEIWLQRGDEVEPASLFSVDRNGNGVGAVPGDLSDVEAVLVTRERAGGAMHPTEQPVVSAKT